MARKKTAHINADAPETKEDLARVIRIITKYVDVMIACYRGPLMDGEPMDGWIRLNDEFQVRPEWGRFLAAYHGASNLLTSAGRLAAVLGFGAEASQLADLAGVLALSPRDMEDLPLRRVQMPDGTASARFDDHKEPVRSMVVALVKAQYALDLLGAQVESGPRDLKRMVAKRTEYAMRLRQGPLDLTWEEIVKRTDEAFPRSMGLPELTSGALRSAWVRMAEEGAKHDHTTDD